MEKIKLSKWAKRHDYTYRGAWNLINRNKIPYEKLLSGAILVIEDDNKIEDERTKTVIYSRVSSSMNKSNLDSQADRVYNYCIANGWRIDAIIKECASGLNDKRPKLNKILLDKTVKKIVVEHKDRLTRFGFDYIKNLFGGEIVVINESLKGDDDIIQDFVSIITSFCAKIYGKRRSKRKTQQIIEQLEKNDKESINQY